ncbi:heterokaryon incompatibility protein [Glarea lozoyensis ATCC 20868]|uniref:Heterokaryon incompatibility protein n=1 Tax=Glarea lozoyensis (strain ATCC 20868 / MF5171) TaxID=1116229 RepID=S3D314_GLAL2|nr:heterokaryon incompatibility protein [Glarea lozoyensis ATCC 20868]EPE32882.1 heterokaryon incompatibility protein [Glarea lozoyensis ATCC 20868]
MANSHGSCKLCQYIGNPITAKPPKSHTKGCPTGVLLEAVEQKRISAGGGAPVRYDGREFYLPAKENPQDTTNKQGGYGFLSDIHPNSGSKDCFNLIRQWAKRCDNEHKHSDCKSGFVTELPKRVIDVGSSNKDGNDVRLYERSKNETAEYIALSHCWGKDPILTTTLDTLSTFKEEIRWDILPKTFQDAITVTRELGIRYLWSRYLLHCINFLKSSTDSSLPVDSLCIIQDSASDWEEEAPKMCDIYSNSYIAIAAAIAVDAQAGFLRDRKSNILPKVLTGSGLRCRAEVDHVNWPSQEPILSRAWCYQERLVPRRLLSYRVAEVTWECRTTHWCECGRAESYYGTDRIIYERTLMKEPLDKKKMYDYWHQKLLVDYTQLSLTRESDRLAAVSALAFQFQERLKVAGKDDVFLAGFWRSHLLQGLAWRCLGKPGRGRKGIAETGIVTEPYLAPTWSWASIQGPINFEKLAMTKGNSFGAIDVINMPKALGKSPEENGLTMRGRIFKAQITIEDSYILRRNAQATHWMDYVVIREIPDDHTIPHYPIFIQGRDPMVPTPDGNCVNETAIFWPDCPLAIRLQNGLKVVERRNSSSEANTGKVDVWCFLLYSNGQTLGALVLSKSNSRQDCFERVGFMELYHTHPIFGGFDDDDGPTTDLSMAHLDEQEITII